MSSPLIDVIADAMINRRVIEQHPKLQPLLSRPTSQCVYDGRPSVEVITGPLGQRVGHCAECAKADKQLAATWPRTWTFTNRHNGRRVTITCLPGCTASHERHMATPTFPEDIVCGTQSDPDAVTLPITDDPECERVDYRVLNTFIEANPFSQEVARRLPHVVVEVLDEHYIEPLDPDGLETVINVFAGRLDELRRVHAELVRVRAAYAARETRIDGWVDQAVGTAS